MNANDYKKATAEMTPTERAFYDILLKMLTILEKEAVDVEP